MEAEVEQDEMPLTTRPTIDATRHGMSSPSSFAGNPRSHPPVSVFRSQIRSRGLQEPVTNTCHAAHLCFLDNSRITFLYIKGYLKYLFLKRNKNPVQGKLNEADIRYL